MLTIITEPSVYLVGSTEVRQPALADFLRDNDIEAWSTDATSGGEALAEIAGRGCYWSFKTPRPGGNKAYIQRILEQSHGSVLEHACFNFFITGVSRSFTHELVRHRAGMGYSQLSQRFVDESESAFVVPVAFLDEVKAALAFFEKNQEVYDLEDYTEAWERTLPGSDVPEEIKLVNRGFRWLSGMEAILDQYRWMSDVLFAKFADISDPTLRRKKAREAARSVLSNATETKIFVTGNARAFRHLIEMRGDIAADAEIRRVAIAVLKLLQAEAPNLFGDYQIVTTDGVEHVTTEYRKV